MSDYIQAPEYLCGHLKSEIKDEETLKLIDAAYNQGRRDQASTVLRSLGLMVKGDGTVNAR